MDFEKELKVFQRKINSMYPHDVRLGYYAGFLDGIGMIVNKIIKTYKREGPDFSLLEHQLSEFQEEMFKDGL